MNNVYTPTEYIGNVISFVISKLFYPGSRLIRRPFYLRGKSSLKMGQGLTIGHNCRIDLPGDKITLQIGNHCEFGDNVHIVAHELVEIGDNVLMASKIFISDTSHGNYKGELQSSPDTIPNKRPLLTNPVYIEDNVWLGDNVVVLPGVTIGYGSVIGANSVVNSSIPPRSIAVGSPARVIKQWNEVSSQWVSSSEKRNTKESECR